MNVIKIGIICEIILALLTLGLLTLHIFAAFGVYWNYAKLYLQIYYTCGIMAVIPILSYIHLAKHFYRNAKVETIFKIALVFITILSGATVASQYWTDFRILLESEQTIYKLINASCLLIFSIPFILLANHSRLFVLLTFVNIVTCLILILQPRHMAFYWFPLGIAYDIISIVIFLKTLVYRKVSYAAQN